MAEKEKPGNVPPRPPTPPAPKRGIALPEHPESAAPAPDMPEKVKEPLVLAKPGQTPPLFIKVNKYEDVVKNVQELRSYALSLRDALDAIADIEKELKVGMEIAHKSLDRLNIIISSLDAKLLRTEGIEIEGNVAVPKEVEGYIKNVYSQIERLKGELKAIK